MLEILKDLQKLNVHLLSSHMDGSLTLEVLHQADLLVLLMQSSCDWYIVLAASNMQSCLTKVRTSAIKFDIVKVIKQIVSNLVLIVLNSNHQGNLAFKVTYIQYIRQLY